MMQLTLNNEIRLAFFVVLSVNNAFHVFKINLIYIRPNRFTDSIFINGDSKAAQFATKRLSAKNRRAFHALRQMQKYPMTRRVPQIQKRL